MGVKVVVVDDTASIRSLVKMELELLGFDVMAEAENGTQALEVVEDCEPDIVVMDREMPIMDGPTATREIRRRWPGIQVVGLTSYPIGTLREAGAIPVFNKTEALDEFLGYMEQIASR
jgi:two-component system, NarL family, response regulator LiaR